MHGDAKVGARILFISRESQFDVLDCSLFVTFDELVLVY